MYAKVAMFCANSKSDCFNTKGVEDIPVCRFELQSQTRRR